MAVATADASELPIPEAEPVQPAVNEERIPAVADLEFIGDEQQGIKAPGVEAPAAMGLDAQLDGLAEELQLLQPRALLVEGLQQLWWRRRREALEPGAMADPGGEHPREGKHQRRRGTPEGSASASAMGRA